MMSNGHLPAGRAAQGGGAGGAMTVEVMSPEDRASGGPGAVIGVGSAGGNGGTGTGGRNGGGRRGRHYSSHYHNQNNRHNQNGYNQNGFHNQHNQHGPHSPHSQHSQHSQYHNSHQMGQPMYPSYMGPYVANPYTYAQMPPQYAQNGAMPTGFVPYQQGYGRPMNGAPSQYAPMMPPGAMPPMPGAAPGHPPHPSHPSLPPHQSHLQHSQHPQHQHPQHQHPQHSPQHHTPLPHMSPYARNDPAIVSGSMPLQPLLSPLPPLPTAHAPVPQPQHMPLPTRADVLPHPYMQQPLSASGLPPTPSSTISSHAPPAALSPAMSSGDAVPFEPEVATAAAIEAAFGAATGVNAPAAPAASFRPPVSRSVHENETMKLGDMAVNVTTDKTLRLQLPWLSRPDVPFPPRSLKLRRRRKTMGDDVELPQNPPDQASLKTSTTTTTKPITRTETPSTQDMPSEDAPSTSPTTPSSGQQAERAASSTTPTPTKSTVTSPKSATSATRTAVPIIPAVPIRPTADKVPAAEAVPSTTEVPTAAAAEESSGAVPTPPAEPAAPSGPKLWSGLFNRSMAAAAAHGGQNGAAAGGDPTANGASGAFTKANANSLAEALVGYRVDNTSHVAFIEPRGLINTGNMCYMNSVLQVLVFCTPFYDFLDQVGRKAAYRFKSDTPMLDAMIMFIREFRVIDYADPLDLPRRLKSVDLERFGDAFTPEFVYEAIKQLSRFESMRRGHQQDAEEFLGFLLECLNEECTKVVQDSASGAAQAAIQAASANAEVSDPSGGDGWLEVGPRQRAAITRSSGHTSTSPVNSIFGGKLRSELRVPGLKDSVTLEPYQSLQLDIDSPQVRNIVDALRGLTKPEVLHGDFGSPHGKDVSVTKQVFIETLPPVLILHLKRFQFDWQGNGTVKIWKKIGYPLELEIPREIFGRQKRNRMLTEALPKYRLNGVVYHHGKQASGGHYTVDALREDGREWIRLDDTVIRRIRSEEVAEGGAEEAVAGRADTGTVNGNGVQQDAAAAGNGTGSANRFAAMEEDDAGDNENGWRQVTAPVNGAGKKWSSIANGSTAATSQPKHKDSIKDNKVAYLLFYQRVN